MSTPLREKSSPPFPSLSFLHFFFRFTCCFYGHKGGFPGTPPPPPSLRNSFPWVLASFFHGKPRFFDRFKWRHGSSLVFRSSREGPNFKALPPPTFSFSFSPAASPIPWWRFTFPLDTAAVGLCKFFPGSALGDKSYFPFFSRISCSLLFSALLFFFPIDQARRDPPPMLFPSKKK